MTNTTITITDADLMTAEDFLAELNTEDDIEEFAAGGSAPIRVHTLPRHLPLYIRELRRTAASVVRRTLRASEAHMLEETELHLESLFSHHTV